MLFQTAMNGDKKFFLHLSPSEMTFNEAIITNGNKNIYLRLS